MKTFSSKLLYYSMYQYITKVLPTIFGNYTNHFEILRFLFSEFLKNQFASSNLRINSSGVSPRFSNVAFTSSTIGLSGYLSIN